MEGREWMGRGQSFDRGLADGGGEIGSIDLHPS